MNKLYDIKVIGQTFEGYYYDESDAKIEVTGEFDLFGPEVRVVAVETYLSDEDVSDIVDTAQIEEIISSQINLEDYTSEYDHEEFI
jgi:hypothetical protein